MLFPYSAVFEASRKFFNEERHLVSQPSQLPRAPCLRDLWALRSGFLYQECSSFLLSWADSHSAFQTQSSPHVIITPWRRWLSLPRAPSLLPGVRCAARSQLKGSGDGRAGRYFLHQSLSPGVVCIHLQGEAPLLNSPRSCLLLSVLTIFIAIVLCYFCLRICLYPCLMHTPMPPSSLPTDRKHRSSQLSTGTIAFISES